MPERKCSGIFIEGNAMKCVCPMGGDRTCPDDCPLSIWAGLSSPDRKAQRKPIAERLYSQGFTMEAIATQLGVTHKTISLDLREICTEGTNSKPTKSASNPKGAGRPKGTLKPERRVNTSQPAASAARLILDEGKSYKEIEKQTGLSNIVLRSAVAREEGRREPQVKRADLSLTAQEKFDAAISAYKRKLQQEFEQHVLDEIRKRIDEMILPEWKRRIEEAKKLYRHRRGAMDKPTFNKIRRALHPDSRNSISDKVLGDAFDTFMSLEKFLLDEKDSPTDIGPLPESLAEWDKMRATARKAKRNNAQSVVRR